MNTHHFQYDPHSINSITFAVNEYLEQFSATDLIINTFIITSVLTYMFPRIGSNIIWLFAVSIVLNIILFIVESNHINLDKFYKV